MLELVADNASGVGYLLKDRVPDVAEFIGAVERVAARGTAFDPRSSAASSEDGVAAPGAIERHVEMIVHTLGLADSEDDNRRVLAVLALLGR
jgi:hypothetical protein